MNETLLERTRQAQVFPKIKNEAKMPVGDITYTLRYDLGAIDAFETIRNESIAEVFAASLDEEGNVMLTKEGTPVATAKLRTSIILDLLWAGLLAHHGFGRAEVGHIIGLNDIQTTVPYIMQALAAGNQTNFPKVADAAKKNANLRKK